MKKAEEVKKVAREAYQAWYDTAKRPNQNDKERMFFQMFPTPIKFAHAAALKEKTEGDGRKLFAL